MIKALKISLLSILMVPSIVFAQSEDEDKEGYCNKCQKEMAVQLKALNEEVKKIGAEVGKKKNKTPLFVDVSGTEAVKRFGTFSFSGVGGATDAAMKLAIFATVVKFCTTIGYTSGGTIQVRTFQSGGFRRFSIKSLICYDKS